MKRNKIVITSVAALLSVGVLAGSIALYEKVDKDISVEIGGKVYTDGALTLESSKTPVSTILSPENKTLVYEYKLGLNTSFEGTSYNQDVTMGNLALNIAVPQTLKPYVHVSATILGYGASTYGAENYKIIDKGITGDNYLFEANNIVFKVNGTQKLQFTITLNADEKTFAETADLAGNNFNYTVDLKQPTQIDCAYLVGTMPDSNWQTNDKYRMYPAIDEANSEGKHYRWFGDLGGSYQVKATKEAEPKALWSKDNIEVTSGPKDYQIKAAIVDQNVFVRNHA